MTGKHQAHPVGSKPADNEVSNPKRDRMRHGSPKTGIPVSLLPGYRSKERLDALMFILYFISLEAPSGGLR
jgi:hypothetical protein